MVVEQKEHNVFTVIWNFFPLRLLLEHIKHNLFALVFWVILFGFISDKLASGLGVPFLFLSPEYLGHTSFWSFLFLGFSFGGFFMAFNTYSFIQLGPYFPFLINTNRTFHKFCINNSIIPIVFLILFSVKSFQFQVSEELTNNWEAFLLISASWLGVVTFFLFSALYFFPVDLHRRRKNGNPETLAIFSFFLPKRQWIDSQALNSDRDYFYLGKNLRLAKSRSVKHLSSKAIRQQLIKNRVNASLFEILAIGSFVTLGLFSFNRFFEIPAGASITLLLTIILMIFNALRSWTGKWVYPIIIGTFFLINILSAKTNWFQFSSSAFGIDYKKEKVEYSNQSIIELNQKDRKPSLDSFINTLNNWKKKTEKAKPKLIIINTSGGGSRSATWTVQALQECSKKFGKDFNNSIQLITGASGGMLGASYYRSLILEEKHGKINSTDSLYLDKMSQDLLNKLSFTATTNDIFIRLRNVSYNGNSYTLDRGFSFEEQLNANTDSILNKKISYFREFEENGTIPTMIFTPTVVNDGRRLLVGSQSFQFLANPTNGSIANENIDFYSLLDSNQVNNLRFTSAIRMNATFPYIMPMISLPTNPKVQVMDAGLRDNYGGKLTLLYLNELQDWIKENTSGVIILQLRDTKQVINDKKLNQISFKDKFSLPIGNVVQNLLQIQDYNQEALLSLGTSNFQFPVDIVSFNLREKSNDRISLSWHLTKKEKKKIKEALLSEGNQESFIQLEELLKN